MRVTISSSSNDNIDEKYKQSAIEITSYLADSGCDLNWGSGSSSIMGICYEEFKNENRKIYGYTTPKYIDELKDLEYADNITYETTFDLKKNIFNDSDLIIILPGGTGSISEFFAYLEEIRSNDKDKKMIVYNINHHFDKTIDLIEDLVNRKFNGEDIFTKYIIINNLDDFINYFKNNNNKY